MLDDFPAWGHAIAAVVSSYAGFVVGRARTRVAAATVRNAAEHGERAQLFQHYNELVQTNREVNNGLRTELQAVRSEVAQLHLANATAQAAWAQAREECMIEITRLTTENAHLRAEIRDLRRTLRAADDQ